MGPVAVVVVGIEPAGLVAVAFEAPVSRSMRSTV